MVPKAKIKKSKKVNNNEELDNDNKYENQYLKQSNIKYLAKPNIKTRTNKKTKELIS